MITVEKLISLLQEVPDKQSWVLTTEKRGIAFLSDPNPDDPWDIDVLGRIHTCSAHQKDCRECRQSHLEWKHPWKIVRKSTKASLFSRPTTTASART